MVNRQGPWSVKQLSQEKFLDHWPYTTINLIWVGYKWSQVETPFWVGPPQTDWSAVQDFPLGSGHRLRQLPQGLKVLTLLVKDCVFWATLESPALMSDCTFGIIIPKTGDPLSLCWICRKQIPTCILNLWFTMLSECWMILDKPTF